MTQHKENINFHIFIGGVEISLFFISYCKKNTIHIYSESWL